jgi:hypothetical protein
LEVRGQVLRVFYSSTLRVARHVSSVNQRLADPPNVPVGDSAHPSVETRTELLHGGLVRMHVPS